MSRRTSELDKQGTMPIEPVVAKKSSPKKMKKMAHQEKNGFEKGQSHISKRDKNLFDVQEDDEVLISSYKPQRMVPMTEEEKASMLPAYITCTQCKDVKNDLCFPPVGT